MGHKLEDVNIGDEIIFNSSSLQSNHDEYWKVTGKKDDRVNIELKKGGFDETWTVDIKEVLYIIPLSQIK